MPAPPSQGRERYRLHAASQRAHLSTSTGRNCSASHPSGERSGHRVACATSGLLSSTLPQCSAYQQHKKKASVLLPLRSIRTLARINPWIASRIIQKFLFRPVTSNKKDCKGNPRSVPCKGPSALRVRPVKISTAGKDEPAAHLSQEGGGRIFTDSTLTSPVPGACKAVLFYFSFFFRVFLSVSFFRKQS